MKSCCCCFGISPAEVTGIVPNHMGNVFVCIMYVVDSPKRDNVIVLLPTQLCLKLANYSKLF